MIIRKILDKIIQLDESKGSDRVLANKKMVQDLADTLRDDMMIHPAKFPAGFARQAKRMSDQDLAKWFLDKLDEIEARGYEGFIYSRDGVNNEWITRRYIAGSHNWEDIEGTANMNLAKWYYLKNRNLLDVNHQDLWKFNSIRDIGSYMAKHYQQALTDYHENLLRNKYKKNTRAIKLIDNEDYRVYMVLNRSGACSYGLGANWCTANTESRGNYDYYSGASNPTGPHVLYQVYPKDPDQVDKEKFGRKFTGAERYQFDAGSYSFMDIADDSVRGEIIQEKFPHLYYDVVTALKEKQVQLQEMIDQMKEDPTIKDDPDHAVKDYSIANEIRKLEGFLNAGRMKNVPRTQAIEQDQPSGQLPPPAA
jgi:hypothetical protein